MPKFTGLPLDTLYERLGRAAGKRVSQGSTSDRHSFQMFWFCNGPKAPACIATAEADDKAMPPGLTPWEQEMFDHADFPKYGWTVRPPRHRNDFADHPEEAD